MNIVFKIILAVVLLILFVLAMFGFAVVYVALIREMEDERIIDPETGEIIHDEQSERKTKKK